MPYSGTAWQVCHASHYLVTKHTTKQLCKIPTVTPFFLMGVLNTDGVYFWLS